MSGFVLHERLRIRNAKHRKEQLYENQNLRLDSQGNVTHTYMLVEFGCPDRHAPGLRGSGEPGHD
jgi:hypothetical protein